MALSVVARNIAWDSLPAVVRERMDRSRVFDRGLTDVQALILEVRCELGMRRVEFGKAVGLVSRDEGKGEGKGRGNVGPGVSVYRWEAGLAVPNRAACAGMVRAAREGKLAGDLVKRLEALAAAGRRRTGTPWGQGRPSRRTSGL